MSIIPQKLRRGDKVMIIAPSRSLKLLGADCRQIAEERLKSLGLEVVFAPETKVENADRFCTGTIEQRVADIHTAFGDKSVKGVLTVIGGFNSNQLLKHLDYELIKQNPKIFMGFSDITALHSAIYSQTGLVTYYGPHYSSLGMLKGCEYTIENMVKMLFENGENDLQPSAQWSDDAWYIDQQKRDFIQNEGWWQLQSGTAEGTIIGGNLCTLILQLGTPYFAGFKNDTILFIEDDEMAKFVDFERCLQALINQPDFGNVKGIVIGRFQKASNISRDDLAYMIATKPQLRHLPVIANIDMGHTTPIATIPLGGRARMENGKIFIKE